jgi:hypothetical protein
MTVLSNTASYITDAVNSFNFCYSNHANQMDICAKGTQYWDGSANLVNDISYLNIYRGTINSYYNSLAYLV